METQSPIKFPSDAEVIAEEAARYRALTPDEREQVSLNTYINGQLAAGTGWGRAPASSQEFAALGHASRRRVVMWALAVNVVVVAFAAAVALLLLLSAWNDI